MPPGNQKTRPETVKQSARFQTIARAGKRWSCAFFILQALKKDTEAEFNFGLTASRKVGNAVVRNRAKRRLRELVRDLYRSEKMQGWDVVIIAKTASASSDFAAMRAELHKGFAALGILS